MPMNSIETVAVGFEAVDRRGEMIGAIEQVGRRCFLVTKGLIFKKDVYVPFSAIDSVDGGGGWVRLNVDKDQIDTLGWDEPPVDGGASTNDEAGYVSRASGSTTVRSQSVGHDNSRSSVEEGADSFRLPVHEEELRAEKG
jgi:hypothetical protein